MKNLWQSWAPIFNDGSLPKIPDDGIDFSESLRLERLPDWLKSDEALNHLHRNHRSEIKDLVDYGFKFEYQAESFGDPDPDFTGEEPFSKQDRARELFFLANLALWIVRPSPIRIPVYFHFNRPNDPASLAHTGSGQGLSHHQKDTHNKLSLDDISLAAHLHEIMFNLNRKKTVWLALRILWKSLPERMWDIRVLIQWIAIESLFGPQGGGELTYRISQRIAFFLGQNREEAKEINQHAKKNYGWRSNIVHGSNLNKISKEESLKVSYDTQEYVRLALLKILQDPNLINIFNSKGRDAFLDQLAFENQ